MQIETRSESDSTGDSRLGLYGLHFESDDVDYFRPVEHGSDSLAASLDVGDLQWVLVQCLQGGWFDQLQPRWLVDTGWVARELEAKANANDGSRAELAYRLNAVFETEPVEDGMDHPAEEIIKEALLFPGDPSVLEWLRRFCLDAARPNFAASVMRCLGRQAHPGTITWRTDLVCSALNMYHVEIRDAAVQAAELWGGQDMRNVLEAHNEPLDWLRNYVLDVIDDIGA